jgi:hypothetical protein
VFLSPPSQEELSGMAAGQIQGEIKEAEGKEPKQSRVGVHANRFVHTPHSSQTVDGENAHSKKNDGLLQMWVYMTKPCCAITATESKIAITLEEPIEKFVQMESELRRAKRQKLVAWGAAAVAAVLAVAVVYARANTAAQGSIAGEIRARKSC